MKFYSAFIKMTLLAGCVFSLSGIMRHDVSKQDYLDLAAEPQFDCVGIIMSEEQTGGSCVLIAPRYVLTAAHCFVIGRSGMKSKHGQDSIDALADARAQLNGMAPYKDFVFKGKRYKGKRISVHPNYLNSKGGDIALVELELEVEGIVPAVLNFEFDELHSDVVGVGFGASGIANQRSSVLSKGEKIAGQNVIDSIGGAKVNEKGTVLFADFDHPEDATLNKMGSEIPSPLEYGMAGGDSGGGLFRQVEGRWELVGIASMSLKFSENSNVNGYYGMISGYTRTSAFTDWIENEMNQPSE